MSRKAKYTVEQKIRAAERYIRGEANATTIAAEMGMPASVRTPPKLRSQTGEIEYGFR